MDIRLPAANQNIGAAGYQASQFGAPQTFGTQNYPQTWGGQPWGGQTWAPQGVQNQVQPVVGFQGQMQVQPQIVVADCLYAEKYAATEYGVAAMEASNVSLRNTFLSIQAQEHNNHRRLWEYMNQNGWYQVESAPNQTVSNVKNRTSQQVSSLRQTSGWIQ